MNRLDKNRRTQVIRCSVEGNSIRATVRMTEVSKNAIQRLLAALGPACEQFHDRAIRNLPCKRVQCDEIWSFLAAISGNPNPRHISTSFVERQNLTMRMQMRRFTRLTNAFSKKVQNLGYAVALHFMHYNFCRVHQTLRVTPAMEAGLTAHVWTIEEVVGLLQESVQNAA